jgi:hypothetical protein
MKNTVIKIIPALFILLFFHGLLFGGTSFSITPNTTILGPPQFINFSDKSGTEDQFGALANRFFDVNAETLATGLAMTNTLGYPNGKSTIRKFPFFEIGASAGAGVYQYKRIDQFSKDNLELNPTIPGGGLNGGFHVGTGLTDRIDVMLKFFALSPFYNDKRKVDKSDDSQSYNLEVTDMSVYSFGIKPRYNLLKRRGSVLAAFGGVSCNLGLDYFYARIAGKVDYSKTVPGIEFNLQDPFDSAHEISQSIGLIGDVHGTGELKTDIISITPEVFAYFDLLYLFSFYTGPSVSINSGSFEFNIDTRGTLSNDEALVIPGTPAGDYTFVDAGQEIATAALISKNKMIPARFIPRWTLGLELNIWVLKVQLEASTILTSPTESLMAQVGLRINI